MKARCLVRPEPFGDLPESASRESLCHRTEAVVCNSLRNFPAAGLHDWFAEFARITFSRTN